MLVRRARLFRTSPELVRAAVLTSSIADEKPQQVTIDVDIAARAGVMAADADLLPGHAHDAVGTYPAADPVIAAAIGAGGSTVVGDVEGAACGG